MPEMKPTLPSGDYAHQRQDAEIARLREQVAALEQERLDRIKELAAERDVMREQVKALQEVLDEAWAVCACGCPSDVHDSYGEDGEGCDNDDHDCVLTSRAVLNMLTALRARLADLARTHAAAVEGAFKEGVFAGELYSDGPELDRESVWRTSVARSKLEGR